MSVKFKKGEHNRLIIAIFDDDRHNLPKQIIVEVRYLDDHQGRIHKAIRLNQEIMPILAAAPSLLNALAEISRRVHSGSTINISDLEQLGIDTALQAAEATY